MRLIVHQRLLPKVGGGRVALREYLHFTESLRKELIEGGPDRYMPTLTRALQSDGWTLAQDAEHKHAEGLISSTELKVLLHSSGQEEAA